MYFWMKLQAEILLLIDDDDVYSSSQQSVCVSGEKCILSQKQWFTPSEFERFAGKQSSKNWKLSIQCQGTPVGKLIKVCCKVILILEYTCITSHVKMLFLFFFFLPNFNSGRAPEISKLQRTAWKKTKTGENEQIDQLWLSIILFYFSSSGPFPPPPRPRDPCSHRVMIQQVCTSVKHWL